MSKDVVDLEDLVLQWAKKYELEPDLQKQRKREINPTDINWKYFSVVHDKTVYKHEHQTKSDEAKTHVIFNSMFRNSTSEDQTYHFRAERRTQSTCTLNIIKGYSVGGSLQIKITPPNPVLQANAGFRSDLNLTKARGDTFTESLTWSIDSDVRVKKHHKMDASLVIRETNYKGDFTVKSHFDGRVIVLIRKNKDDPEELEVEPAENEDEDEDESDEDEDEESEGENEEDKSAA